MRKVVFLDKTWQDINKLSGFDSNVPFHKVLRLIEDCKRSPFKGIGKPEALKGDYKGYWSRRLNDTDRLIYKVDEENIFIASILGHYK